MESWFSAPCPMFPLYTKQMKQLEKQGRAGEKRSGGQACPSLYASTQHGAWRTAGAQQIFVARARAMVWGELEEILIEILSFPDVSLRWFAQGSWAFFEGLCLGRVTES